MWQDFNGALWTPKVGVWRSPLTHCLHIICDICSNLNSFGSFGVCPLFSLYLILLAVGVGMKVCVKNPFPFPVILTYASKLFQYPSHVNRLSAPKKLHQSKSCDDKKNCIRSACIANCYPDAVLWAN